MCIGIAFGGDLSTINPGIAVPSRYIYTMAEDNALPKFFGKVHPKYKTPWVAILTVGIFNVILIATGSINYIASVSLISLGICYIIGCMAYIGLKRRYPDLNRPYKAPLGIIGAILTIIIYVFMLAFSDRIALLTSAGITILCIIYWAIFVRGKIKGLSSIEEEIGNIENILPEEEKKQDRSFIIWLISTIIVTLVAIGIYLIPMII